MQIRQILLLCTLSVIATGTLHGTEIYKWTDEEGTVHFTELPTGVEGEEHLAIPSRPTDPARVRATVQARVDAQKLKEQQAASAPPGPTKEELEAAARAREERCDKYRERQTRFMQNRRIYRMDENGERVYYNEEEMQAARDEVQGLVKEYCSD